MAEAAEASPELDPATAALLAQLQAEDGAGFNVVPITDCPHIDECVARGADVDGAALLAAGCAVCGDTEENWVCGMCHGVFCSRYKNGHMAEHSAETGHQCCLALGDLSWWCQVCGAYLEFYSLRRLQPLYSCLHEAKHGEFPPGMPRAGPNAPPPPVAAAAPPMPAGPAGPSAMRLPNPSPELADRIKGLIYGHCVGDAVGLATEFMTKAEAAAAYPPGRPLRYADIVRDRHRVRWAPGDWTDDSDQMLLLLEMLMRFDGAVDERFFARRLVEWMYNGFPELGDSGGCGIGFTVASVLQHPDFAGADPAAAARDVWHQKGRFLAANGAVMRTSVLAVPFHHDLAAVQESARRVARVTHADPRCAASCTAVVTALALLLQGEVADVADVTDAALAAAAADLVPHEVGASSDARAYEQQSALEELESHGRATSVAQLALDEEPKIGYTFKCMGAGFYALRCGKGFRDAITEITMEAGDADTNCAVAGAMLGCKLGFQAIPQEWVDGMPHKEWLDQRVGEFMERLGFTDV